MTIMKTTLLADHPTTTEILHHMADCPDFPQSFDKPYIDVVPISPRQHKSPGHPQDNIGDRLHSVVADAHNRPCKIHHAKAKFRRHKTISIRN